MFASTTCVPARRTCSGVSARTAACVPTTMKAGVRTVAVGRREGRRRARRRSGSSSRKEKRQGLGFYLLPLRGRLGRTLRRHAGAPSRPFADRAASPAPARLGHPLCAGLDPDLGADPGAVPARRDGARGARDRRGASAAFCRAFLERVAGARRRGEAAERVLRGARLARRAGARRAPRGGARRAASSSCSTRSAATSGSRPRATRPPTSRRTRRSAPTRSR